MKKVNPMVHMLKIKNGYFIYVEKNCSAVGNNIEIKKKNKILRQLGS